MCPPCSAELERIPTDTPGGYEASCTARDDRNHRITAEGLGDDLEQEGKGQQ